MSRVSTTLSADAASYIREMQKINAELVKNRQELEKLAATNNKLNNEAQASAKEQESAGGKMLSSVTQWAASLVSVGAAYRAITAEMQNQLEMQQKMAAAQNTVAAAEQRLAMNAKSPQEFEALRTMAHGIARAQAIPIQAALDAVGSANSARGNAPLGAVQSAATIAARALPNNVSEIPAIAGNLLDMRLLTGTNDAAENYGKLAALQSVSRPVSPATTARYLVPSAVNAQSILGAENPYDWLGAAAMMTNVAADPSGEVTGSSAKVIAQKLAQFYREPGSFKNDKGASLLNEYVLHQAGGGAMPEAGRFRRFLQGNSYYRDLFLNDAKLGVRSIPGAEALLNPAMEASIQENIRTMQAATADVGERQLAGMENTPANQSARAERIAKSATEFAQLSNPIQAQIGAFRNQIGEIEQSLGYSGLRRFHEWAPEATQGLLFGPDAQVEQLRGRVGRALQSSRSTGNGGDATQELLQRMLNSLDGIAAGLRQQGKTHVGPPETK